MLTKDYCYLNSRDKPSDPSVQVSFSTYGPQTLFLCIAIVTVLATHAIDNPTDVDYRIKSCYKNRTEAEKTHG